MGTQPDLERTIAEGVQLFDLVLNSSDPVPPFAQWKRWVFETISTAADFLRADNVDDDPLSSIASLLVALARQDVTEWTYNQRAEIQRVLHAWQADPRPPRELFEEWYDHLADAEVHVLPW